MKSIHTKGKKLQINLHINHVYLEPRDGGACFMRGPHIFHNKVRLGWGLLHVTKPTFKRKRATRPEGVAATPIIKSVLIGHMEKERRLGAPIRNVLITTPSTLTIMLPMSFMVP